MAARAGLSNSGGDLPSWTRLNNDATNNPGGVVGTDGDSFLINTDKLAAFPATGPADFANPGSVLAGTTTQAGKTVIVESSRFLWQARYSALAWPMAAARRASTSTTTCSRAAARRPDRRP